MSKITLNIIRGKPDNEREFVAYEVPYVEGMSLLDALFWVREHKDPSLAVRYSCRSANACKECMAFVDGKADYLCSMRAKEGSIVKIEPMIGRPWLKDLTVIQE